MITRPSSEAACLRAEACDAFRRGWFQSASNQSLSLPGVNTFVEMQISMLHSNLPSRQLSVAGERQIERSEVVVILGGVVLRRAVFSKSRRHCSTCLNFPIHFFDVLSLDSIQRALMHLRAPS